MTRALAVLGASGHGKVVADMATMLDWKRIVFFDDASDLSSVGGHWTVEGTTLDLIQRVEEFTGFIVAIGNRRTRLEKHLLLIAAGGSAPVLVHPRAFVSSLATLGAGTVVVAGAVINVDAAIGVACVINSGATVGHDCKISDGVHVAPGANLTGGVTVGSESWIGAGSVVRQGLSIGAGSCVGIGAVVTRSVGDRVTVVGNPAKLFNGVKNP